jgi:DNA-binding YbaB/EbfC family protein
MAKGRFPMGGMPGGANMNNMIKQAQKMQENLLKAQQEIEEASYDITAGGGAINLTINGANKITKIQIDPEIVDPDDVEMLEDLMMSAFNEAIKTVEKEKAEKMGKVTGGFGGMGGLF